MNLSRITHHVSRLTLQALLLLALLGPVAALAQSGGGYDLTWNTVDSGGGLNSHGGYTLEGTAGQPDAGSLANGEYTLSGGFWGGGAAVVVAVEHKIYLPLVLRTY